MTKPQHVGHIPLKRADLYPHGTIGTPTIELEVRYADVSINAIEEDTVTLTVRRDAPDPRPDDVELPFDHLEFDLDPDAARRLAADLLAAADLLGAPGAPGGRRARLPRMPILPPPLEQAHPSTVAASSPGSVRH